MEWPEPISKNLNVKNLLTPLKFTLQFKKNTVNLFPHKRLATETDIHKLAVLEL